MPDVFIDNDYSPYFITNAAEELCYGIIFILLGVSFNFLNPLVHKHLIPSLNISE